MLWWLSLRTQGDYEDRRSGYGAPTSPAGRSPTLPLVWARPVKRQRSIHLVAAAGVLFLMQGLPGVYHAEGLRLAVLGVAVGLLSLAAVLTVLPWSDRPPRQDVKSGDVRLGDARPWVSTPSGSSRGPRSCSPPSSP